MIVVAGGVLYNGSNPNCRKSERLDIIKLVDKALEVAPPSRVGVGIICCFIIPAMHVVAGVAVIKTGCDYKVNRIAAQVGSVNRINLRGVVVIPAFVLVPPFAGGSCELVGLNSVSHKQKVNLCNVRECVLVVLIALGGHRGTGVISHFVLRQRVPVVNCRRAAFAVVVKGDSACGNLTVCFWGNLGRIYRDHAYCTNYAQSQNKSKYFFEFRHRYSSL